MSICKRCAIALAVILSANLICLAEARKAPAKTWKFVSVPDFVNVDLKYPEPKWDDTLDYVLDRIKAENPDFVIVAGDLLMGRWWKGKEQIEELGDLYYTAWCKRMKAHGLKYYAAVGDHELGDNPWRAKVNRQKPRCADIEDVPLYERAFVKHLRMPQNGPEGKKGLTYSFVHKGTLFVVIDVFEKQHMSAGRGTATVTGKHLEWVQQTLKRGAEADHVIVVAHPPILGPVRAQSSSRLMLKGGAQSPLWRAMKKHGADLYLCGEVHAITSIGKDGIEQVSHGMLLGYNDIVNYMVVTVSAKKIELELKAIKTDRSGGKLPQTTGNRPREYVNISQANKKAGFKTVGKMVISKAGGKKAVSKTGVLVEDNNPPTGQEAVKQGNRILMPYLK